MAKVAFSVLRLNTTGEKQWARICAANCKREFPLTVCGTDAGPLNSPVLVKRNTLKRNTQLRVAFECVAFARLSRSETESQIWIGNKCVRTHVDLIHSWLLA